MRPGEAVLLAMFVIGVLLLLVPAAEKPVTAPAAASLSAATPAAEPARQPPDSLGAAPAGVALAGDAPAGNAPAGVDAISLADYSFDPSTASQWKLPQRLKEISGLALTADGRLLAHNDEEGIVFEIDDRTGAVTKSFAFCDPGGAGAGDFEGIAVAEDALYLVTSDGRLYQAREGRDGERVACVVHDTALGRAYEIEGLAFEPRTRELLLASKGTRGDGPPGPLSIFRWSIDSMRLAEGPPIEIPVPAIVREIPGTEFNASGIERHPRSGHYFLVAARQNAIAEITLEGALVAVRELSSERHRQVEGITFGQDDRLILADEGAGKRARLTSYPVIPRSGRGNRP